MRNPFSFGTRALRVTLVAAALGGSALLMQDLQPMGTAYAADPSINGRSVRSRVGSSLTAKSAGAVKLAGTVILATNSVHLEQNSEVFSGDVIVNDANSGPFLADGVELMVGISVDTPADYELRADSIKLKQNAVVDGDVFYNELDNNGTINGSTSTPLTLPVFAPEDLPPCEAPLVRAGAPNLTIPIGGTASIDPGEHGDILVKKNGVLTFTGGNYNIRSLNGGISVDFVFEAPSVIRIEGKFDTDQNSFVGPAPGSGIDASDILFIVGGINGNNGNLGATPKAAQVGLANTVQANFCVPNGTLWLRQNSVNTGSFIAKDVDLGISAEVYLDSAYGDQPPTADPQTVTDDGVVTILLTGSDPEGTDLAFAIEVDPTAGTLTDLTEIVPAPIPDPPNPDVQPPVTSATVKYTPNAPGDPGEEDSFTFSVTDAAGNIGMAVVTINPFDTSPPVPATVDVDAEDVEIDVSEGATDLEITLVGEGPDEVDLTFRVLTLPAGTLKDSANTEITSAPADLPDAKVKYTPPAGTGDYSFQYSVRDSATAATPCPTGSPVTCDTAVVEIAVDLSFELAPDQQLGGNENEPLQVSLTAARGGVGDGGSQSLTAERVILKAAFPGAMVAGSVADNNDDGEGDNVNNLPGSTPGLISAGVDLTGAPGSNGTARIHIEFDITSLHGTFPGETRVVLTTNRGSIDALDTKFFAASGDGDGNLTVSDFETAATELAGVVMPVTGAQGVDGTFAFDVTTQLQIALQQGFEKDYLVIQGRVDEGQSGPARGLQIRSSATSNPPGTEPQLVIIGGIEPPPVLVFRILSLPEFGTLRDTSGNNVVVGQTFAGGEFVDLLWFPNLGFVGSDSFDYSVTEGLTVDTARISALIDPQQCIENGREPDCAPGGGQ